MPVNPIPAESRLCLVTVTTDSFVPGTLVMIYSFLKHNQWFAGDIVIIHDGLTDQNRGFLSNLYEKIRFQEVSWSLKERVDDIVRVFPHFSRKQARFYSLDAFRLRDYERVLFLDSDVLFRDSIQDLIELPQTFIVCGDRYFYEDRMREWATPINGKANEKMDTCHYSNTFNSGLILVDKIYLTDDHYAGLLDLVDYRMFQAHATELTDQMVLNIYFSGDQHLVNGKYNYLLTCRAAIDHKEGVGITDAHAIHFNGPFKPWRLNTTLRASQNDPVYIKALEFWFDSFLECLPRVHMGEIFGNMPVVGDRPL